MNMSSPEPHGRPLPPSPLVDALREDEDVEDVTALSTDTAPEWFQHLSIPPNWHLVALPNAGGEAPARMTVCGPLGNGEWEAAETFSVIGFTGRPVFYDVFHHADRMLRDLEATSITIQALPVPAMQWVAALRSSGIAVIGDRSVWVQQSNYVAGSEQPHAGLLIIHSLFVDAQCRERLAKDVNQLSEEAYQGFIDALRSAHR